MKTFIDLFKWLAISSICWALIFGFMAKNSKYRYYDALRQERYARENQAQVKKPPVVFEFKERQEEKKEPEPTPPVDMSQFKAKRLKI